ncbi:MAG: cytochrome b6-f complex subunit PetL [Chroococcales cyanobacterium]
MSAVVAYAGIILAYTAIALGLYFAFRAIKVI